MNNPTFTTEVTLDPTIQLHQHQFSPVSSPKTIFLTGATGLVGAYMLSQFLHQTNTKIYCLVRSGSQTGYQRIEEQLRFYHLWQDEWQGRIIPVIGDLSQPLLGLSKEQFNQLADGVELIYHSAAQVTPIHSYTQLRSINVQGTEEILRLATTGSLKAVHYVSSAVIFFSQSYLQRPTPILETEIPQFDPTLKGGYKQSKWVAEQLVWQAKERGMPVSVYRPSRILADTNTGITGKIDLFWKVIIGCLRFKKYPAVDTELNLVPVDYVSQAIIELSQQEQSIGQAFHLVNPQSISWHDLWQQIRALGYSVEPISYDDWVSEINQQRAENKLFAQLRLLLRAPIALFKPKPIFDTKQTEQALQPLGLACPSIDGPLLNTYLTYLQQNGHISRC